MGAAERLDAYQRKHPWAGFPLAVVYKFFDDQGAYLAALITYYGFLSLFPLLLLLSSILGFVLQNDPALQHQILDSALRQVPVLGRQLDQPGGLSGSVAAVVVGVAVAIYGALGIAQALQNAMNVCWAVPRHRRPNPFLARLRSLMLIGTAGLALIGTTVLSALGAAAGAYGVDLGWIGQLLLLAGSVLVNAAVFVLAFRISTAHRQTVRQAAPGALTAAVVWQVLQAFGTTYAGHVVRDSSDTYGVFAVVLGLLGWIFLGAVGVVLAVELNVVRAKRLYPRALLTPFTDDVQLTDADERAYRGSARAQQLKGFQSVKVTFNKQISRREGEQPRPDPDDREGSGP
jgi:YihY family inner membrane protein